MTRKTAKKHRLSLKLTKSRRKHLHRMAKPFAICLIGFSLGVLSVSLARALQEPDNLVWAADSGVKIPGDLKNFLLNVDNDCEAYRGKDSPDGIGLWGVYQVSGASYAKIAYGCSWSLSSYIMAVKYQGAWQLIQPTEYFAPFRNGVDPTKGALPFCEVVDRFTIPKDIEPFCILPDGSAKANEH